jgi:putative transposase
LKVANQRSHFLHQITHHLVKNNDEIVIEDLNVNGMTKNRKLAKSITDANFSAFRTQLTYKCAWYGKKLTVAPRFYPSSKTCSSCGTVKKELMIVRIAEKVLTAT